MEIESYLPLVGRSKNTERSEVVFRVGGEVAPNSPTPDARSLSSGRAPRGPGGASTSPRGGGEAIVAIAGSFIGTPYVHQASAKGAGCDCLGLLRGVWRELHGDEPEDIPPYSADWAEATGEETLYMALRRHLTEIAPAALAPGDVALFRMSHAGPAKHCGIIGSLLPPPERGRSICEANRVGVNTLTLIHARQNRRVIEEPFSPFWRRHLSYAFRLS